MSRASFPFPHPHLLREGRMVRQGLAKVLAGQEDALEPPHSNVALG
jgi:hypothetical protein